MSCVQNRSTTENHSIYNYDNKNVDCETKVKRMDPRGHAVVSPNQKDLIHMKSSPPWRPGKRTGHTNTEEGNSIYTNRRDKQTHRGRERHDNMQTRERRGKAESPGGDDDPDQHLDEALTDWREREREVPGWLMVQHREA